MSKTSTKAGIITGGITDPYSDEALDHAELYYESLRRRKPTDVEVIASRTQFTVEQVLLVRNYLFVNEHDLEDGYRRFDCSFEIAQSWQRLSDINMQIESHDITLIKHELLEIRLVQDGFSQRAAHEIASLQFNYTEESFLYYSSRANETASSSTDININSGAIRKLSHTTH